MTPRRPWRWPRKTGIATLILPADVSWEEGAEPAVPLNVRPRPHAAPALIERIAEVVATGEETVLFLGGDVLASPEGQLAAARVAAGTGVRLLAETFTARTARGGGLPHLNRLPYPPQLAIPALAGTKHLVLAGATAPVHFFGYPGLPGHPVPEDCTVHVLSQPGEDGVAAIEALAELAAPGAEPARQELERPELPSGPLNPRAMSAVIGALLPEDAIIVDEALTSGVGLTEMTSAGPRHDWLSLTGGAIGDGLPMSLGAAVACPDRPVIGIQGDGSAMYTISALWSFAREQADITTIICDNSSYAILQHELVNVGAATDGKRARQLLDLGGPALDFVSIAQGMGVPASRATTAEELAEQVRHALAEPGPHVVVATLR
ncbi:acetolactate synthase large subunit [Blastococcus sp. TML/M2B]|uniref:acetolactate synthase large subunit n=1 Tax=Blastococcus sp. TML/M2B TaxID=2798727 RepID=UPI002815E2E8|nr:acetolactate synthase large subunit [Blastococcus sp. TML/M2B]